MKEDLAVEVWLDHVSFILSFLLLSTEKISQDLKDNSSNLPKRKRKEKKEKKEKMMEISEDEI